MTGRDIAPAERPAFFARFSRLHKGALITLRIEAHDEVVDQPFRGVSPDGEDLVIHTGDGDGLPHHGHRVAHVANVRLEQTDEGGADAALEITSDDGLHTAVVFHSPMREDVLDPAVE